MRRRVAWCLWVLWDCGRRGVFAGLPRRVRLLHARSLLLCVWLAWIAVGAVAAAVAVGVIFVSVAAVVAVFGVRRLSRHRAKGPPCGRMRLSRHPWNPGCVERCGGGVRIVFVACGLRALMGSWFSAQAAAERGKSTMSITGRARPQEMHECSHSSAALALEYLSQRK